MIPIHVPSPYTGLSNNIGRDEGLFLLSWVVNVDDVEC